MATRLIAHQISKAQHTRDASVLLRSTLLPADSEAAISFTQALRNAHTSNNPIAGRFRSPAGARLPFEQRLRTYLRGADDGQFVAFSHDAANLLLERMKTESAATGGYVIFCQYDHGAENFLLVALLSTRAQPSFDKDLNLVQSIALDFDHLRHAGRVRYSGLTHNDDGVVHYVSRRQGDVSDYFREFLGCEPVTDSAAQGRYLYTALRSFADTQKMDPEDREAMMQQAYTYSRECKKHGRPIQLTGLANSLRPDNPTVVLQHLSSEGTNLAGEFPVPPDSVMRKFVKFAFNRKGLKLEFDRTDWLDKVSTTNGSIVIKEAPAELIEQITSEKGNA